METIYRRTQYVLQVMDPGVNQWTDMKWLTGLAAANDELDYKRPKFSRQHLVWPQRVICREIIDRVL